METVLRNYVDTCWAITSVWEWKDGKFIADWDYVLHEK